MTRNITISNAVERYLNEREGNISDSTRYNHSSQLNQFIEWCESGEDRPDNAGEIDGWSISDFKIDRRDDSEIKDTTLYNQMTVLRCFIQWCESRDLIEGVSENIIIPNREDPTKDEKLDPERGEKTLKELRTYEYASTEHTLFAVLWTTGVRIGTARAMDLEDYNSDEMYMEVHHRPEEGTPLKNKTSAERQINLHEWVCVLIDDYIKGRRHGVTDEYGRKPLFTTGQGRAHRNTLRKKIRNITRPCEFSNECPYDRNIESCEATQYDKGAKCPGSVSPHPLRRSAITNFLNEGHSKELVSDRMDVSVDVLDKHYDARTEDEKRELRREMFEME
jgi:site-specific recombinase XerD